MNKTKAIQIVEKYKDITCMLALKDDEAIFNDIIVFLKSGEDINISGDTNQQKRTKYGESEFQNIVSSNGMDIFIYDDIDTRIIDNKNNLLEFWHLLSDEEKKVFLFLN